MVRLTDDLFVESVDIAVPGQKAKAPEDKLTSCGETLQKAISSLSRILGQSLDANPMLSEIEVSVGLKFSAEGSVFIAKTSGEASLEAKFVIRRP